MARDLLGLETGTHMLVSDIMNRQVHLAPPNASVQMVAALMRSEEIGTVVVADGERIVGIVTDRDLTLRVLSEGLPLSTEVASVMSSETISCAPEDDVREALRIMRVHQIRRTPVISKGRIVGIISLSDIAINSSEREELGITLSDLCERASRSGPAESEHRQLEARHI